MAQTLAKVQQQLDVRRRARLEVIKTQRRKAANKTDSMSDEPEEQDLGSTERSTVSDTVQAPVVWLVLLVLASWLMMRDQLLVIVAAGSSCLALYGLGYGLLLPTEASVQQLAVLLSGQSMTAGLVSSWDGGLGALVLGFMEDTSGQALKYSCSGYAEQAGQVPGSYRVLTVYSSCGRPTVAVFIRCLLVMQLHQVASNNPC